MQKIINKDQNNLKYCHTLYNNCHAWFFSMCFNCGQQYFKSCGHIWTTFRIRINLCSFIYISITTDKWPKLFPSNTFFYLLKVGVSTASQWFSHIWQLMCCSSCCIKFTHTKMQNRLWTVNDTVFSSLSLLKF